MTQSMDESRKAAAALRSGEATSVDLIREAHAAADRLDPQMGTWLDRYTDQASGQRRGSQTPLSPAGQDRGPLHGIPLGIKGHPEYRRRDPRQRRA